MKMRKRIFVLIFILVFCLALAACGTAVEYTVTFDYDGVKAEVVTKGDKVTPPDVEREDYEVSWFSDEDRTVPYDFDAPVERDMTLYPKWEKVAFTVKFEGEGLNISPVKVKKGASVEAPEVEQRQGYNAVWYNGSEEYIFGSPVMSDLTLRLEYVEAKYRVRFYDGAGRVVASKNVSYGDSIDVSQIETPEHAYPDFYTFTGWDKDVSNVTSSMDVKAVYDYRVLPDEIFDFELLPDGNYAIKITEDESALQGLRYEGCYGLPAEHEGRAVTRVSANALGAAAVINSLDKLLIPSSYKIICNQVLWYSYINEIVVAEGVEEVWGYAFQYFRGDKISLPSTLTYIEPFAFNDCGGEVVLKGGEYYIQQDGDIYTADKKTLVYVNFAQEKSSYTFIESVENIYPMLFDSSYALMSVTFEGNIKRIPTGLFSMCDSLQSVTFNGTVSEIAGFGEQNYVLKCGMECPSYEPFEMCVNIRNFVLPEGLRYIGDFALEDVTITEAHLGAECEHIGLGAIDSSKLERITVDESNSKFRTIGDAALVEIDEESGDKMLFFAGKNKTTALSENDLKGVVRFEKRCFNEPKYLERLSLPDGVTAIPALFVYGATKLESISIPSTVTSLADSTNVRWSDSFISGAATVSSEKLNSIEWRGGCGLSELPSASFAGAFERFTVPASVLNAKVGFVQTPTLSELSYEVEAGNVAYVALGGDLYVKQKGNAIKLVAGAKGRDHAVYDPASQELGDYVISGIGASAFANNYYLRKAILPAGVTSIEQMAFYNCLGLKEVELPSTLRSIEALAFFGCSGISEEMAQANPELSDFVSAGLEKVTFNGAPPTMAYEPNYGYRVFDSMYYVGSSRVIRPMPSTRFVVPADRADDYFEALYAYGGEEYSGIMDVSNLDVYTYKFVTNGGVEIPPITDAYVLYEMPVTEWQGEGEKCFVGWYSKNGENGEWGEEITFFEPFRGTPNDNNEVVLYAKWDEERRRDGTQRIFAYDIDYEPTSLTLSYGTGKAYWFEFTADKDGKYNICFDFGGNVEYAISLFYYDAVRKTVNEVGYDYDGFQCERGKTYFFRVIFPTANIYSSDWSEVIGSISNTKGYDFYIEYYEEQTDFPF